jgi:hypothetical protein
MRTDGKRADKHGEANIRFLKFCECAQKENVFVVKSFATCMSS